MSAPFEDKDLRGCTCGGPATTQPSTRTARPDAQSGREDSMTPWLKRALQADRDNGLDIAAPSEREARRLCRWVDPVVRGPSPQRGSASARGGSTSASFAAGRCRGSAGRSCRRSRDRSSSSGSRTSATQGLAPATVRRIHAPVRAALADAADDGLIPTNPASGVRVLDRAQVVESDDERAKALARDELAALVKATEPRWQPLMRVLAVDRPADQRSPSAAVARPRPRDPRRGARPPSGQKDGQEASIGPPKSKAGRRTIPLPHSVAGELRRGASRRRSRATATSCSRTATGGLMSDENLRRRVLARAAKAAGVPWVGFHTLRHTSARC